MTTFKNLTPHCINLNDGTKYPSTGTIARVNNDFTPFDNKTNICHVTYGDITGLPDPITDTYYIVSALVLSAAKAQGRTDCVAPATGHPHCIRDEKGFIISVPGFIQ